MWQEILRQEGFSPESELESSLVWREVFHKMPDLKNWLKRREIMLLKATTLKDKPQDFILGQITENRLWQSYDIPAGASPKVETKIEEPKIPDKKEFLDKWGLTQKK